MRPLSGIIVQLGIPLRQSAPVHGDEHLVRSGEVELFRDGGADLEEVVCRWEGCGGGLVGEGGVRVDGEAEGSGDFEVWM